MKRFAKYYSYFEDFASGLFLVSGLGLMFWDVILRYVFNSPTTWINGISAILVVWAMLLGMSLALRDNHHISVDILYELLPSGVKRIIDFFANVIGVLFCIFFVYNGIVLVSHIHQSGQIAIDTLVPVWLYYLVIPISGFMFMIRFLEKIWKLVKYGSPVYSIGEDAHEHKHAF
jgi:C4-dicarboxylate transporter DctQ subunit